MKNITAFLSALIVAAIVGVIGTMVYIDGHKSQNQEQQKAFAGNAEALGQISYLVAGSGNSQDSGLVSATTTRSYLVTTATASSTISGFLGRANRIDINLRAIASSTAARLNWALDTSPNGVDYYPYEFGSFSTTSPPFVLATGDAQYTWSLSTTSATIAACGTNEICKHAVIDNVYAPYYRIRLNVSGSNASVWGMAQVIEPLPN